MADWPQAGANAQRTSLNPTDSLTGTTWAVAWRENFQIPTGGYPIETLLPTNHPINTAGSVLQVTMTGFLHSFADSATKTKNWRVEVGAPVIGGPASDGTRVYLGDADGRLHCFTIATGARPAAWSSPVQVTAAARYPVHGSVLYADGKVIACGADGRVCAFDPVSAALLWTYTIPATVLMTPSYGVAGATGIVVVGAMNMKVYAINAVTGALVWESAALEGMAFKDYWPVIHQSAGMVLLRPAQNIPAITSSEQGMPSTPLRGLSINHADGSDASLMQDEVLLAYAAIPANYVRSLIVLNLATGADTPAHQLIHWYWPFQLTGAQNAPCIDRDGHVVIGYQPLATYINRSGGHCRVSMSTRKIVDTLKELDGAGAVVIENGRPKGYDNRDENAFVSACANQLVALHMMEGNAFYSGFWNQDTRVWKTLPSIGPATHKMHDATEGMGASPPIIASGGRVYHNAHPHTLMCWRIT